MMRTILTMGLALGLGIAAGPAGAAEARGLAQQGGAQAQPDRATEAAKHFAVANAGLESAEANAEMLFAITKKPELYDEAHGKLFVTNIKDAIAYARGHIAHIQPLVQTDAEKRELKLLNERVDKADSMVTALESNLTNVQELHRVAGTMEKQLDESMKPLENLAKTMKVDVDVG